MSEIQASSFSVVVSFPIHSVSMVSSLMQETFGLFSYKFCLQSGVVRVYAPLGEI